MVLSMEYVLFSVAYEVNLVRFWYPQAMKWLNKSLIISLWSQTIPWKICVRVLKQWITRPNDFGPMTTRKGDTKPNKTVKGHKRPYKTTTGHSYMATKDQENINQQIILSHFEIMTKFNLEQFSMRNFFVRLVKDRLWAAMFFISWSNTSNSTCCYGDALRCVAFSCSKHGASQSALVLNYFQKNYLKKFFKANMVTF